MKALYILDAYGLIYSSYYAFISRPLTNSRGANVSAAFGFFRTLFMLWELKRPEYFVCAFDSRTPTFRHRMYDQYKANRQKTPQDLHDQIPLIEEILDSLGLPRLQAEGYEADDLIACLAEGCRSEGRPCYIISKDKDLLQLVDQQVSALRPDKELGFKLLGPAEVEAEWGLAPASILDYLALTGDASDNIPGVPGVGDKTALKLLKQWGSFEAVWQNLDQVQPASLQAKLRAGRESAELSLKLVRLATDLPLRIGSIEDLAVPSLNRQAADPIFQRENMKSLLSRRSPGSGQAVQTATDGAARTKSPPKTAPAKPVAEASPATKRPETSYQTILDLDQLDTWLERAAEAGLVAFDCETDSLDEMQATPVGFSLALGPGQACYLPLEAPDTDCLAADQVRPRLAALLARPDLVLVGQNLKFDIHILENWGLKIAARAWDTMIAAWLIDPDRSSYKLENLAEHWLGYGGVSFKEVLGKADSFSSVPLEEAAHYAAEDADMAWQLKAVLEAALAERGLLSLFLDLEMPVLRGLCDMERRGILVDRQVLSSFQAELETSLAKTQADAYTLAGHEFNLNSPKQLQEVLFVERRLSTGKKTKTGYSTDVSVLEELAREDPLPALILRHRGMQKLKSTYVDALLQWTENTPRIHTHFVQTGAATGRLSSREPNLQNIPIRDEEGRRIRQAFVAAPGYRLISADYAQIELVVFAHLAEDQALRQAFLDAADVHRRTAALIFNLKEDDVGAMERRAAKTINFGIIYGMGAFRLAQELSIPRKEAQGFIDAYFQRYHGVASFIQTCIDRARELGYAQTLLGRRRPIPTINSRNANERQAAERVAVNTPIQGSAADIMKLAMLRVDTALRQDWPDARCLLQVHDELIIEAPQDQAEAVARRVQAEMTEAYTLSVPLRVSVEHGPAWGDIH